MRFPILGRTIEQLNSIGKSNGATSEAVPYAIYDTQSYPAAGSAAGLQFFLTQQADQTLGNLQTAGILPQPQWFEIHGIHCDFLAPAILRASGAAATVADGQLNDIELILKAARATWELNIAQKSYGVMPLTLLHASGGGIGVAYGAGTAATVGQWGNNGIQGDTWAPNGSLIIPPTQGFNITLRFQPTLVPVSQINPIRIMLIGVLHRAVR